MNKMHMCGDKEKMEIPLFYGNNNCVEFMFNTNVDLEKYDCTQSLHITLKKTFRNCYLFWLSCKSQKRTLTWMKNQMKS